MRTLAVLVIVLSMGPGCSRSRTIGPPPGPAAHGAEIAGESDRRLALALAPVKAWADHVGNLVAILDAHDDCDRLEAALSQYTAGERGNLEQLLEASSLDDVYVDMVFSRHLLSPRRQLARNMIEVVGPLAGRAGLIESKTRACLTDDASARATAAALVQLHQARLLDSSFGCTVARALSDQPVALLSGQLSAHSATLASLQLPTSAHLAPSPHGTVVSVTPDAISVNDRPVVQLERGVVPAAQVYRGGFNIAALFEATTVEADAQRAELARSASPFCTPRVNLLVDERVSYRLLYQVLYSLGQAGFLDFVLAASTPGGAITGNWISIPFLAGGGGDDALAGGLEASGLTSAGPEEFKLPPGPPPLNLAVSIQANGLSLAGSAGVTDDPGGGPTLALKPGEGCDDRFPPARCFDLDGLTAKLVEIKRAFPNETMIIVSADLDAPYGLVHQVFERAREQDGAVMFPQQIVISF